jgi:hypothetical protein
MNSLCLSLGACAAWSGCKFYCACMFWIVAVRFCNSCICAARNYSIVELGGGGGAWSCQLMMWARL